MPLPIKQPSEEKIQNEYRAKPTCDCGACKKCKNRERQRRYYDAHRTDILTGDIFLQRIDGEGQ